MVSKAGRLAIKRASRGRPRMTSVEREPNGRISRAKTPREPADRLALSVRARQLGISLEEARDPHVTTYIGRLYRLGAKAGGISVKQYDAALRFLEVRNRYLWAIQSPAAIHERYECTLDDVGYEESVRRDKACYEAMMREIRQAQFEHRHDNLYAPLQYIVIDDVEWPHLVGTLRVILNVLHHYFFLDKRMS